jgi:hypothetical protein
MPSLRPAGRLRAVTHAASDPSDLTDLIDLADLVADGSAIRFRASDADRLGP